MVKDQIERLRVMCSDAKKGWFDVPLGLLLLPCGTYAVVRDRDRMAECPTKDVGELITTTLNVLPELLDGFESEADAEQALHLAGVAERATALREVVKYLNEQAGQAYVEHREEAHLLRKFGDYWREKLKMAEAEHHKVLEQVTKKNDDR